jgi:type I restriction-modification system DNA methylase subunit
VNLERDVITILDGAVIEGMTLCIVQQLDRKLYERTNKALIALGGKWNKKARAHLFDYDPAEAIEMAVLTGIVVDHKREMGFFETPEPIVRQLIDLAEIDPFHAVLEPSAGLGAIARCLPGDSMLCELDQKRRNVLIKEFPGSVSACHDFLAMEMKWDRIVANPPFGGAQRDVDHVRHMWDCLNLGGIVVSVMASGITFRDNRKTTELRELIEENGEIIPLPERSFRESGTDVNTVIVRMQK